MIKLKHGTPKTLKRAIKNAFEQYSDENVISKARLEEIVHAHLSEFIRNKLSPIMGFSDNPSAVETYVDKFVDALN